MTKRRVVTTTKIYQTIKNRFLDIYGIDIAKHIAIDQDGQVILWEGYTTGSGFGFKPKDYRLFRAELEKTKRFKRDNPDDFFGALAGSMHKGAESWREEGTPSLHCAIEPDECSCHIDAFGFVLTDPEGRSFYDPDLFQHIGHDLIWQKIVTAAWSKSSLLGEVLSHAHPHVPNSSDKYRLRVGVGADLLDVKDRKGEDLYKLTIDFSEACMGPRLCEKSGPELTVAFKARF